MPTTSDKLIVKCVFCNAEWDAEMEMEYASASQGCDSCGHGSEIVAEISIRCTNCEKIVYRKELRR